METDDIEIGLSGLPVGPFPKPEEIGPRLSQWLFLSEVEALGFSQDELVGALTDYCRLFGGSSEDWAKETRRVFISQFNDTIGKLAEKVPKTYTVMESGRKEPITYERTEAERAAEVLALFGALYAYLSCVEREGPDRANTYSFLQYETLSMQLPAYVFKIPELLSTLQQKSPSEFTKRLREYPNDAIVMLRTFKQTSLNEGIKKLRQCAKDSSIKPPTPEGWIIAGNLRKVGESGKPDLHDAGYYLESLAVSQLIGREDFITKGVNLSVAQEESLAIMDGNYAELGGDQGVAESLAQDYLDKRSQGISKASLLDGEAFRRAEEALNTLESMMTRFKKESTEELKKAEALRSLGQSTSLDTEIEGEDGEIATLADMMPAQADLEEAMPQLSEWVENLEAEDRDLFMEHFMDGRRLDEIAIERQWNYDCVQKRAKRLEQEITQILTKM